jgi:CRP/FNR family transcriptional regulator, dissimilatory nitrate respiration regulator
MQKVDLIGRVPLFADLDRKALAELAAIAEVRRAGRGELLFSEGDEAAALFILAEGVVELVKIEPSGREQFVRRVARGETFAEAAMFSGGVYPAMAIARTPSQLFVISKRKFLQYVRVHPEVSLAIMGAMAGLLRHLNALISELALGSVEDRLAAWLLKKSREAGRATFMLGISKKELAFRLGTVPETLSRNLRKLKDGGVIRVTGERVTILDADSLDECVAKTIQPGEGSVSRNAR